MTTIVEMNTELAESTLKMFGNDSSRRIANIINDMLVRRPEYVDHQRFAGTYGLLFLTILELIRSSNQERMIFSIDEAIAFARSKLGRPILDEFVYDSGHQRILNYPTIGPLVYRTGDDGKVIEDYCLQDCDLVVEILSKTFSYCG